MAPPKSQKLEDQAATAALLVTKGQKSKPASQPANYPLDEQGKLSSASAATSLKHAQAQDLPAYPVVGVKNPESSAGAAASLANQNQKKFEHWSPGEIPAANRAAAHAKDYKHPPLWESETSADSSKAAFAANKEGANVNIWRPDSTDAGNSAAGQAMRTKGLSPQLDYGHTADGARRAMVAATQSMTGNRKRAESTPSELPPQYPDSKNSATNALKAATSVSGRSGREKVPSPSKGPAIDAAKIHNAAVTNLSREMFTSHPPVAPELEEKKKQDTLQASAVAMAKQMYQAQQRALEQSRVDQTIADSRYGASHAHGRPPSSLSDESSATAPQYANLQEAAQKLAAERLAKLHDEHTAYRTYYGTQAPPQHKLSIRGRARRRSSSVGSGNSDDEERSKQIRNQMSLFTASIDQVDQKKRERDRASLLAAAQRNVRNSMSGMDEKVFNETGKISPAMMAEWEAKAKAKAEAESSARMVNHGKVSIGGGRFMDQSEVDAIAAAKVQPTLDEVTAEAEKRRARDEEIRQQTIERERIAAEKEADQKERDTQARAEWQRFKDEEKREAKTRKEEEKAKKDEEKAKKTEEKRKSAGIGAFSKFLGRKGKEEPSEEFAKDEPVASKGTTAEEEVKEIKDQPVLEPIPHVATPMAPEPMAEPKYKAGATDKETDGEDLEPMVTAETGESSEPLSGNAESIAQRVFAAPVTNDNVADSGGQPTYTDAETAKAVEAQQAADATEDTAEAPVTKVEAHVGSQAKNESADENTLVTGATEHISEPAKTHDAPVAARIAPAVSKPSVPAGTTETTVSGPSSKSKESKGVSTWLKTKLRRSSKPQKPEDIPKPETQEKTPSTPSATKTEGKSSSEQGDLSMREVAMAGKENTGLSAPARKSDEPVVSPTSDLDRASPEQPLRESTSSPEISSLSSDEDTRGRSAIPRDHQPLSVADFIKSEVQKGENVDPDLAGPNVASQAPNVDPSQTTEASGSALGKVPSSSAGEYEEARDAFDSEKLNPPPKGVLGGRKSGDSPRRDSRFIEEL